MGPYYFIGAAFVKDFKGTMKMIDDVPGRLEAWFEGCLDRLQRELPETDAARRPFDRQDSEDQIFLKTCRRAMEFR
ncbi:MAG: hypothetical protein JW943_17335 [Deltaproteobacteria bacterium]|nr:hypothetical protein [Deltaproteobacteria bacterium]